MKRAINFNAGPATLPLPALERAREELLDFAGTGMSVMEHSHRGKDYEKIHGETTALLRELMGIPQDYAVLYLQGGASMQFAQLPMNFLVPGKCADYVVTGAWGEKALEEAKYVATHEGLALHLANATAKDKKYTRVPEDSELALQDNAAYVHYTSNETIHGVQFHAVPDARGRALVCDMSSDILSRRIDVSKYAIIYGGAQKNIGPSGVTLVIGKKSFLEEGRKDIPKIFQYRTHVENDSLYNTPPTFGIYLMRNVLSWIKDVGGLGRIESWNAEKGKLLYGAIDAHADFYRCPVEKSARSLMNVVFRLPSEALEEKFVAEAKKADMVGLKGHRSVGGIRVSTYNAVTVEWVQTLVEFMKKFAAANA